MFQKVVTFVEIRGDAVADLSNAGRARRGARIGFVSASGRDISMASDSIDDQLPYNEIIKWVAEKTHKVSETKLLLHKESILRTKRKFGQIDTEKDFKVRCKNYKKYCAIGLLADSSWNRLLWKENETQGNSTLVQLEALARMEKESIHLPMFYSWINVSCHQALFAHFDLTPYDLPALIFYNATDEAYAMVTTGHDTGEFDRIGLHRNLTAFLKNRLPVKPMAADSSTSLPLTPCGNSPPQGDKSSSIRQKRPKSQKSETDHQKDEL